MKLVANYLVKQMLEKGIIEESQQEIYQYGLERFLSKVVNYAALLLLAVGMRKFVSCVIYLSFLLLLRGRTGGYHASTEWRCFLGTVGIYVFSINGLLPLLLQYKGIEYSFIIYSRCSTNYNYYKALKDMGANSIIVGIEALSEGLLKKMDKGCNVIQNMQCLKNCSELGLGCTYNLFYDYPNFSKEDFAEMMYNVDFVSGYQPPESLCDMELQYGSRVYKDPESFLIEKVVPSQKEQMILPVGVKTFLYGYTKRKRTLNYSKRIIKKVKRWSRSYEKYGMNNVLTFDIKDKQVLINDNRKTFWHAKSKYILKGKVAEIFLFCQQVRSLKEVRDTFGGINTNDVIEELKKKRLLFVSESECLSLPIRKNV